MNRDRIRTEIRLLFFAIVFLFLITPVSGSETEGGKGIIWKSDSNSKISIHSNESVTIENRTFLYANCLGYRDDGSDKYVISQNTVWRVGPWEGNNPSLKAAAFLIGAKGNQEKLWDITEEADEGHLNCNFYHTVWYGCCSAGPNHRLYNPRTGRLIMEYSEELLTVEIPNSPLRRYIGYKPSETIATNSWEKKKNHIGTLTYSSPDRILHRVALRVIGDGMDKFGLGFARISILPGGQDQKLTDNALDLWKSNGSTNPEDFTGFSIRLVFYDGYTIIVPINGDRLYLKTGSPDYEIVTVNE